MKTRSSAKRKRQQASLPPSRPTSPDAELDDVAASEVVCDLSFRHPCDHRGCQYQYLPQFLPQFLPQQQRQPPGAVPQSCLQEKPSQCVLWMYTARTCALWTTGWSRPTPLSNFTASTGCTDAELLHIVTGICLLTRCRPTNVDFFTFSMAPLPVQLPTATKVRSVQPHWYVRCTHSCDDVSTIP